MEGQTRTPVNRVRTPSYKDTPRPNRVTLYQGKLVPIKRKLSHSKVYDGKSNKGDERVSSNTEKVPLSKNISQQIVDKTDENNKKEISVKSKVTPSRNTHVTSYKVTPSRNTNVTSYNDTVTRKASSKPSPYKHTAVIQRSSFGIDRPSLTNSKAAASGKHHKCKQCGKGFLQLGQLNVHSRVHRKSTPGHQKSTPSHQKSTLSHQRSTPGHQRSTPGHQKSTPGHQKSTPGHQKATPSHQKSTQNRKWSPSDLKTSTPVRQKSTPSIQRSTPNRQTSTAGYRKSSLFPYTSTPVPCKLKRRLTWNVRSLQFNPDTAQECQRENALGTMTSDHKTLTTSTKTATGSYRGPSTVSADQTTISTVLTNQTSSFTTTGSCSAPHNVIYDQSTPLCDYTATATGTASNTSYVTMTTTGHTCNVCYRTYSKDRFLQSHMKTHFIKAPYACKVCEVRFKSISRLKKHLASHDKRQDKVYGYNADNHVLDDIEKSDTCSLKVTTQCLDGSTAQCLDASTAQCLDASTAQCLDASTAQGLESSTNAFATLTKTTTYRSQSFDLMDSLTHESAQIGASSVIAGAAVAQPIKSMDKFTCKMCSFQTADPLTLLQHTGSHTVEHPYKCTMCDKSYTAKSTLANHRKVHTINKLRGLLATPNTPKQLLSGTSAWSGSDSSVCRDASIIG